MFHHVYSDGTKSKHLIGAPFCIILKGFISQSREVVRETCLFFWNKNRSADADFMGCSGNRAGSRCWNACFVSMATHGLGH